MPWASTHFLCPDADPMAMTLSFFAMRIIIHLLTTHQTPQWPNLTHNSHSVHQIVTAGDGACHSSPSPLSSSSRSPSSAGDGGETSSAGHGSGGANASRSSSPPPLFPHTIMAIIDMKALFPPPACYPLATLLFLKKNKVAATPRSSWWMFGWWALLVGSQSPSCRFRLVHMGLKPHPPSSAMYTALSSPFSNVTNMFFLLRF